MLKQLLRGLAFVFLGLLPSVKGDERYSESRPHYESLSNLISGFKENCAEHQDLLFCLYWDIVKLSDLPSPNLLKSVSTEKRAVGNEVQGMGIPGRRTPSFLIQFPESHLHKRFLVARREPYRKNPTGRGYKRGPGFRSWGGKRDSKLFWQNLDKKTKFRPWGGKREEENFLDDFSKFGSEEWNEKRAKFQNWGGKKSTNEVPENPKLFDIVPKRGSIWKDRGFYLSEPFKKDAPKRPQFQSWGGKRTPYPWLKFFGVSNSESQTYPVNGGEKRKFSSWGGKRRENNDNDFIGQALENWEDRRATSDSNSYKDISGPAKPILDNHATQIRKSANMKTWENYEPPSNDWDEKGREENNTR